MPLEDQFYIGFYNKALFEKAGVTAVPDRPGIELNAACTKLKAAGFTPLVYGNGGQALGAEFYPWYDLSYLMIGQYRVDRVEGPLRRRDPVDVARPSRRSTRSGRRCRPAGCTNPNILTTTDNIAQFTSGKAAMIVDGTWDTQKFTDSMGDERGRVRAAVLRARRSTASSSSPVTASSIMSYSQHKADAASFLAFIASPAGVEGCRTTPG